MPIYEITKFFSNSGSRNEVRMRVVCAFAAETPGNGKKKDASRYIYYVEKLSSGDRVYLQRPASLHKGFDFLVSVEKANYDSSNQRKRDSPKHEDLGADLKKKKAENKEMYIRLHRLLKRVFECKDVSDEEMEAIHFDTGLPVDHILKVIKWLFIEQDIRYWNYSGRNMTWEIVPPVDAEV